MTSRFFLKISRKFSGTINSYKMSVNRARYFENLTPQLSTGEKVDVPESCIESAIENIVENVTISFKPTEENGRDGLYLGTAGISYMYYHLSKIQKLSTHKKAFLKKAIEYLQPAINTTKYVDLSCHAGLLLGYGGIYAVAAAIYKSLNLQEQANEYQEYFYEAAKSCKDMDYLNCGSDELFLGRAGYVAGALWLSKETRTEPKIEDLHEICKIIVRSGRNYSKTHKSPAPLMYSYYNVEYLGAAHGLCTILQVLMSVPGYLAANPGDGKDVKTTVDYLLTLQDEEGNFPCDMSELNVKKHELVHWCHGAPGIVYLMAKAYLLWGEAKYLKSCEKCAELVWNKGLLKKGPGICHGIAGNGYVFLLLYRLTKNENYLHRAIAFAKFMENDHFKQEARVPDNPYSLYEGIAGTACFLGDLLQPTQAEFPFSDVFM